MHYTYMHYTVTTVQVSMNNSLVSSSIYFTGYEVRFLK